jgi:hypothetical protein
MLPECFADEIAVDFPSVGLVVDRMRAAFLGERRSVNTVNDMNHVDPVDSVDDVVKWELLLSSREAYDGLVVPVDVPIRGTCARCGGRGETWNEPCGSCSGSGLALVRHRVRIPVPPGVADGSRVRFRLSSPHAGSVRVEVRIAIRA